MDRALEEIKAMITAEIEEGKLYHGTVRGVKDFGAFVECLPGKEGLVHVSELADFRVNRVEDVCAMGDQMWVKCVGIDEKGRVRLSRTAALADRDGEDDGISEKVAAAKEKADNAPPREDRGDRRRVRSRSTAVAEVAVTAVTGVTGGIAGTGPAVARTTDGGANGENKAAP
jgi:predicted RNA-binding protein with RPS1 domain